MKLVSLISLLSMARPYFSLLFSGLLTSTLAVLAGRLDAVETLRLTLFFVLLTASLNSYNNITDKAIDSITKPSRPLPRGLVNRRQAVKFSAALYAFTFAALIIAGWVHPSVIPLLAGSIFLSYAFSGQPFRLKRFPIVKGSVLVAHSLLFPLLAVGFVRNWPTSWELIIIIPLFIMGVATHSIQDYEDIEGDRAVGDLTLPILLGRKSSAYAICSLYLAAAVLTVGLTHPLLAPTIVLLLLQSAVALLLRRKGTDTVVFRVNALLSLATVVTMLYH